MAINLGSISKTRHASPPRIVLHGQVCRRELAVEIDGVHA